MMLDEMKSAWAAQENAVRVNSEMLKLLWLERARNRVGLVAGMTGLHVAAWLGCVVWLGGFAYRTAGAPRLAGVACWMYSVGMVIALVRQMVLAASIDFGKPVAEIQREVETLRIAKIRTTQFAVLIGILVHLAFLIVAVKAVAGFDLMTVVDPQWVIANLVFAVGLMLAVLSISRIYGGNPSPWLSQIMDSLAGRSLNSVRRFLADLERFER